MGSISSPVRLLFIHTKYNDLIELETIWTLFTDLVPYSNDLFSFHYNVFDLTR